ncbi:MAG: hypothetical protein HGA81_08840 [Chlorobium limicola]|uniref:Uncharacterized protein n=1 Tax=Chlorobium limicola (strain DSM 245 / NBRC 103803 / 6330) TaxID=290315 RepID=B3ECI4_CHLL2|nr:hypothetical protein [Chlorobium limicola]ACD90259.1 conserved hypothetical protein [Chlorobium limicola DSM 245]NTV08691.1 hypothetical protein [Chlorobium limicola]NTV21120.1 hypothetical protein [Chlorobium limicola]
MSDNHTRRVNFALVKITTEQIDLVPDIIEENSPVKINAGLNFGIDTGKKLLKVLFKNEFLQKEIPFITIETGCIFAFDKDSWNMFAHEEKGLFILPKNFAGHLATLTASTARGILHNATEKSPLNRFFIPANNIEEMIKENVTLSLQPKA